MRKWWRVVAVVSMSGFAACGGQMDNPTSDEVASSLASLKKYDSERLCPEIASGSGMMQCLARRLKIPAGVVGPHALPAGLGPAQLQSAYKIDTTKGAGVTVAIVDAMDDPNAESDLAVYRSTFGLPPCTTANGCFRKVDQNGGTTYPAADSGWAGEISLDLDMVSAICPSCKILLVEATSANIGDLGAAVNRAVAMGAAVVSNSYGGPEDGSSASYDSQYYSHANVGIFASSGDSGFGASYPATGHDVIAVGGTALTVASSTSRGWSETAWSSSIFGGGAGSGCSADVSKPSWQNDPGCAKRMEADVSAVADPQTGPATYDTYMAGGWQVVGGTSASSPLVAAIFAMYGIPGRSGGATGQFVWQNSGDFFDVTSGSNGTCTPAYECTAGPGYDGPTGWGTPNGTKLAGGVCTPQCSGKQCGPDGCGGTCGTCPMGQTCDASGQCGTTCTPQCSGKQCGPDGCGGTCGTCRPGQTCSAGGQCTGGCVPQCGSGQFFSSCGGSDSCGGTCGCASGLFCLFGICL
jgi:hypothetical protein